MTHGLSPLLHLLPAFFAGSVSHCPPHRRTAAFASFSGRSISTAAVATGGRGREANTHLGTFVQRLERQSAAAAAVQVMASSSSAATGSNSEDSQTLRYRYLWPRPSVTVDCLIFALDEGTPWILLIKRKNDPFKGNWALPGGFVDENESLDDAARRELEEETSVTNCTLVQTGAYGDPGRDPRGHTITVAFMAWAPSRASCNARAGDDAAEADFFPVGRLPAMAFDHLKVVKDSWARCRFGTTTAVDSSDGVDKGITVEDRASGQILSKYPPEAGAGLQPKVLGALVPAEAKSARGSRRT